MPSDPTFTSYTRTQAQSYAQNRHAYPRKLYDTILDYHTRTGGQFNVLADVGCGAGHATRDLAGSFDCVIGLDAGVEMIQAAKLASLNTTTRAGRQTDFAVCEAECCASGIGGVLAGRGGNNEEEDEEEEEGKRVDVLTAAMAAHWFSMPEFWLEAAKVVKPRGTVALWTYSSLYCHPSTPNAAKVQQALFHLDRDTLSPHDLPPNLLLRDMYANLILPWNVSQYNTTDGECLASVFPESEFVRREWDRDGIFSNGEDFFLASRDTTAGDGNGTGDGAGEMRLNDLAASLGTTSRVARWREAHPDLVDTEKDCIREMITEIRDAMEVGDDQNPKLKVGCAVVLLLFKRR